MKRALCLLIPLLSLLYAQNINVMVKAHLRAGKLSWEISGEAPLPDKTQLSAELTYGKTILPRGNMRFVIRHGNFHTRYFYNAPLLSGEYILKIDYDPRKQRNRRAHSDYTAFSITKSVYHASGGEKAGNIICSNPPADYYYRAMGEERAISRKYLRQIAKMTDELQNFNAQLMEKTSLYLEQKENLPVTEIKNWIGVKSENGMHRRYLEIYESFSRITPPMVVATPLDPSTIMDMRGALDASEYLWKISLKALYEYIGQRVPREYKLADSRRDFATQFGYFQRRIKRCIIRIRKREPFPENLTLDDLERDIIWFNNNFRHLANAYRVHKEMLGEKRWQAALQGAIAELQDWKVRIEDYQKSSMPSKEAIIPYLQKMGKDERQLAETYDDILHFLDREKSIVPVIQELRESIASVDAIIAAIKNQGEASKKAAAKTLQAFANEFYQLEEQYYQKWQTIRLLKEKKRRPAFKKWYDGTFKALLAAYAKKIDDYNKESETREYFPGVSVYLPQQAKMLEQFTAMYLQEDTKHSFAINYLRYHGNLRNFKQKIAAILGGR